MRSFIEFSHLNLNKKFNMTEPHSHDYYEFYFLLEGEREFFMTDKIINVGKNSLIIIPPFVLHKTEGGPYERININISGNYFTEFEKKIVDQIIQKALVKLDGIHLPAIRHLLDEGAKVCASNNPNTHEYLIDFFHTVIMLLTLSDLKSDNVERMLHIKNCTDTILKVVNYLNHNYNKKLDLQEIADNFFLSRTALCTSFNKIMHCSVMKYVSELRITAAEKLLDNTDKTIEEIAEICGFSSASYFGLAFKKERGKSPSNYRKR